MKLLLTLQFIALLIIIIGWGNDVYHRSNYRSLDGGWTTVYNYSGKARILAYRLTYLAGGVSVVGILLFIWSF